MKKVGFLIISFFIASLVEASQVAVFISFSMPENLLKETLKESANLKIPAYLNGLYNDSMPETALKVMSLSKDIPNLNLQIDPIAFERFGIHKVPALVLSSERNFDVIYGHLSIKEGLSRMAGRGDSGFSVLDVRQVSGE